MKHLHERMDDLFAQGNPWPHRTLRTLFDPASAEWEMTTVEEKARILKKIKASGERIERIAIEYRHFYIEDLNRQDIADDFENGLLRITDYLLSQYSAT
jgi:hypothetical protein